MKKNKPGVYIEWHVGQNGYGRWYVPRFRSAQEATDWLSANFGKLEEAA